MNPNVLRFDHYYRGVRVLRFHWPGSLRIEYLVKSVRCRLGCCAWHVMAGSLSNVRRHVDAALAEPGAGR